MDGYHWRRQYPIGPYFADFACIKAKLIVELDGCSHDGREQSDINRDFVLNQWGWTTLRITNTDLMRYPDAVWQTIVQHLNSSLHN
jgi:very-short-patch-repair endonuclease